MTPLPDKTQKIYLKPGELFWGNSNNRIDTILGSCVAVCLWHPIKKVGGMCHIVLPGKRNTKRDILNPKYGDDAITLILNHIQEEKTFPKEYITKIFGGGNIITNSKLPNMQIGRLNIEKTIKRLADNNFDITVNHTGGDISRKITFDLWNGEVWLKKI